MSISIIIPTCNRNDLLKNCLQLLVPEVSLITNVDYEIIVTDDSKGGLAQKLIEEHFPTVKWISGPKRGPAANRNSGAHNATGDWLVFIDDDCLPQEYWVRAYVDVIKKDQSASVLEGYTTADKPKERFDEEAPINTDGGKLWSCNFAIKKSVFVNIGGFDEAFPSPAMEDIDFYYRVKRESEVLFVPKAVVIHPWRRVQFFKNFKKHLSSNKYFAQKYGLSGSAKFKLDRFKIFVGSIFYDLKDLIKFSMKGWPMYIEKCVLNFCMIFI